MSVRLSKEELQASADRHVAPRKALRGILAQGLLPEDGIEYLEITTTPAGEVTYRWRLKRSDEWEVGYIGPGELS